MKGWVLFVAFGLAMAAGRAAFASAWPWLDLRVGQVGYVGLNDENYPVCPMRYVFDLTQDVTTCPTIPRGTLVRVIGIQKGRQATTETDMIAVEIQRANGRGRSGWVPLFAVQPIIPTGTRITLHAFNNGNGTVNPGYWRNRNDPIRSEVTLPGTTDVELVRQVPPDNDADFLVRFLNGPKKGQTGWTILGSEATVVGTKRTVAYLGS
ncbi:MAG: hypothetical protein JWM87_533 [Candidatus Eremiobacteraeota bacterium]|nr:hypothetical protein [Candidatus Eremiobacteraeota bacterium]